MVPIQQVPFSRHRRDNRFPPVVAGCCLMDVRAVTHIWLVSSIKCSSDRRYCTTQLQHGLKCVPRGKRLCRRKQTDPVRETCRELRLSQSERSSVLYSTSPTPSGFFRRFQSKSFMVTHDVLLVDVGELTICRPVNALDEKKASDVDRGGGGCDK